MHSQILAAVLSIYKESKNAIFLILARANKSWNIISASSYTPQHKKKIYIYLGFLPKLQSWYFLGCPLPFCSGAFLMLFTDGNNTSLWVGNTLLWKIIGLSLLSKLNAFCSLFFGRTIYYIRECDLSLSKLFPSRGKPHVANSSIASILAIQLICLIQRVCFFFFFGKNHNYPHFLLVS